MKRFERFERFGLSSRGWVSKNINLITNVGVGLITVTVVTGLFTYIIVPHREDAVRSATIAELDINAQARVTVYRVKADKSLTKYTEITQELFNDIFIAEEVPQQFATLNPVIDPSLAIGKIPVSDLRAGDQLSTDELVQQEEWFDDYDRLKEYDIYNTVGGQIAAGNIVDVVVNYGDGNYDVVMAKKKIKFLRYDGMTTAVGANEVGAPVSIQSGASSVMVFDVDETEYADLEVAKKKGKFEVRIYLDESQPASDVTFQNPNRRHSNPIPKDEPQTTATPNAATNAETTDQTDLPVSGYQIQDPATTETNQ